MKRGVKRGAIGVKLWENRGIIAVKLEVKCGMKQVKFVVKCGMQRDSWSNSAIIKRL